MSADHQALIVGGGAAGLSAALVLGRARVDTLLVDAGEPSNLAAPAIGGLLGQHDTAPGSLYAAGREQLAELPSVTIADDTVTDLADGLRRDARERRHGDRRPPAAGHGDALRPPGRARAWSSSGAAPRSTAPTATAGSTATGAWRCWAARAPPTARLLLRQWSDDVVVLADDVTDEDRATLDRAGIPIDDRPVAALEGDGDRADRGPVRRRRRARARRRHGVRPACARATTSGRGWAARPWTRRTPRGVLVTDAPQPHHRAGRLRRRATCRRRCSRSRWPSPRAAWPRPRCTSRSCSACDAPPAPAPPRAGRHPPPRPAGRRPDAGPPPGGRSSTRARSCG